MQKFFGRVEKTRDYRRTMRGHNEHASAWERCERQEYYDNLTHSGRKAVAAAQQDIVDYYGYIPVRFHKKAQKPKHHTVVVMQRPVMVLADTIVVRRGEYTDTSVKRYIERIADIGKLKRSLCL